MPEYGVFILEEDKSTDGFDKSTREYNESKEGFNKSTIEYGVFTDGFWKFI